MSDTMSGFIKSLDSIYSLHDDPEMFSNMVRKIMNEMQSEPALQVLLADEDIHTMIRGLRQHAGMAQVKRVEAKEKRGKSTGGRKGKTSESVDSALESLNMMFGGIKLDVGG